MPPREPTPRKGILRHDIVSLRANGMRQTWAALKAYAARTDQPLGPLVKEILDEWLKRHSQSVR